MLLRLIYHIVPTQFPTDPTDILKVEIVLWEPEAAAENSQPSHDLVDSDSELADSEQISDETSSSEQAPPTARSFGIRCWQGKETSLDIMLPDRLV